MRALLATVGLAAVSKDLRAVGRATAAAVAESDIRPSETKRNRIHYGEQFPSRGQPGCSIS